MDSTAPVETKKQGRPPKGSRLPTKAKNTKKSPQPRVTDSVAPTTPQEVKVPPQAEVTEASTARQNEPIVLEDKATPTPSQSSQEPETNSQPPPPVPSKPSPRRKLCLLTLFARNLSQSAIPQPPNLVVHEPDRNKMPPQIQSQQHPPPVTMELCHPNSLSLLLLQHPPYSRPILTPCTHSRTPSQ